MSVLLETSKGDIVIDLFVERCPNTCLNFLKLCKIKYYNNCLFFKIVKDFIIQTGDPTNTGEGGSSIHGVIQGDEHRYIGDEVHEDIKHDRMGRVAMASKGPHLNASQFFITAADRHLDWLDQQHTVFGQIAEGMDILLAINEVVVDQDTHRPLQAIRLRHTIILEDPFPDPEGLESHIPAQSPPPSIDDDAKDLLDENEDERAREEEHPTEEREEERAERAAESRAISLALMGDIPHADIRPPENVLFVCKLNPDTTDEDLELVFSRFGRIRSCEIIRDRQTGDSLCYAFIEFDNVKSCEEAYFKMENVLIDERRIHVDFSQSVSKLWKKYLRGKASGSKSPANEGTRGELDQPGRIQTKPVHPSVPSSQFVFNEKPVTPKKKSKSKSKTKSSDDRHRRRSEDRYRRTHHHDRDHRRYHRREHENHGRRSRHYHHSQSPPAKRRRHGYHPHRYRSRGEGRHEELDRHHRHRRSHSRSPSSTNRRRDEKDAGRHGEHRHRRRTSDRSLQEERRHSREGKT